MVATAVCPWMQDYRCHNETINPQPHDVDNCLVCLLAELVRELQIRREG